MSTGWDPCPLCGASLSRENASRLRSGAVVHIGCPKNDAPLQAAVGPIREAFGVDPGLPVGPGDPDITPEARPRTRGRKPAPPPAPLVQASGSQDHEALGRERYHDTPEAERAAQIPRILELTKAGTPEADRRFADGWMAEHARAKREAIGGSEIDLRSPPAPKERRRISLRGADALPGLPFAGIGGPVAVVSGITPALVSPKVSAPALIHSKAYAGADPSVLKPPYSWQCTRCGVWGHDESWPGPPPENPPTPTCERRKREEPGAIPLTRLEIAGLPRLSDGTINNCAITNGFPEGECQMCRGVCPDKPPWDPKPIHERHAAEMKAWLDPKGDQGGPVPWLRTDEALRIYSAAGGGHPGVRALCAKIDDGSWSVGRCEGCGVLLAECTCPDKAARLRREKLPPDPHPVPQLAHAPGLPDAGVSPVETSAQAWPVCVDCATDSGMPPTDSVPGNTCAKCGLGGVMYAPMAAVPGSPVAPVHMLVPGFPGHACCGASIEVPAPEAGKPPASGPRFTTTRKLATCTECLEIYDDAEALGVRCEDLRGEEDPADPEEEEDGEEDTLEAYFRKLRDEGQIAMLNDVPAQHHGPRADGELIHLFDGFPEVRASGDRVETRCGLSVLVDLSDGRSLLSSGIEVVPYLHGHLLSCPRCGELPAPCGSRSYGAFVPPDRIGKPVARQGPIVDYAPRQKAKRGRGRSR